MKKNFLQSIDEILLIESSDLLETFVGKKMFFRIGINS